MATIWHVRGIGQYTCLFIFVYNSINSTKFPASDAGIVSEPRFMTQVRDSARKSCARRSVCLCIQSGGGVSSGLT